MDVKRVESVAVPTAIATVGAGAAGYFLPRAITKNGEATFPLLANTALDMEAKDAKLMKEADTLDRFIKSPELGIDMKDIMPTEKEIKEKMAKDGGKYNEVASNMVNERLERYNKLQEELAKNKPTEEETQKFLEKFVRKHAKELEIEKKEGQTLADAAKEYLKGKTAADVKEAFLPSSVRKLMLSTDYVDMLERTFNETYDKATKQFKNDEISQAAKKMFKAAERNLRLKIGGTWAAVIGGTALVSSLIASSISNKK